MKKKLRKGKFIVFEGGEACGKSTQIKILQSKYRNNNNILFSREPGGTLLADEIRKLITQGSADKMLPETELALIYAARFEHLHKFILPNLEQGKHIICDRFYLSSYIYQGIARGLSRKIIDDFNEIFLQEFKPNLTILFDLDLDISLSRIKNRGNEDERFEKFDKNFHKKIRQGFLDYAKQDSTIKVIDANNSIEEITKQICDLINIE